MFCICGRTLVQGCILGQEDRSPFLSRSVPLRGVPSSYRYFNMIGRCSSGVMRALGLRRSRNVASRCVSTLVIAEHDNKVLNPSSLSAVTAAAELNGDVTLLILGYEAHDVAQQVRLSASEIPQRLSTTDMSRTKFNFVRAGSTKPCSWSDNDVGPAYDLQAAKITGVSKVLHADDPAYEKWVAENISRVVASVQVRTNSPRAVTDLVLIFSRCTYISYHIPFALPARGCYTAEHGVICVCSSLFHLSVLERVYEKLKMFRFHEWSVQVQVKTTPT